MKEQRNELQIVHWETGYVRGFAVWQKKGKIVYFSSKSLRLKQLEGV